MAYFRSYLVPSYGTAKREEAEALDVLAQVLGGGSRLYRYLVVDKRLATSAGAAYQGSAVDPTRFAVYAAPQPGTSLPDLENEIDEINAEIAADGVAADELEHAKTRLIADATYAQDNQSSMARWFGVALSTGSTVQDVLTWPDRIRAVSAAQGQSASRSLIFFERGRLFLAPTEAACGGGGMKVRTALMRPSTTSRTSETQTAHGSAWNTPLRHIHSAATSGFPTKTTAADDGGFAVLYSALRSESCISHRKEPVSRAARLTA